jgi:hypothetical protein
VKKKIKVLIVNDESKVGEVKTMSKIYDTDFVLFRRNDLFYVAKNRFDAEFKEKTLSDIEQMKKLNKYAFEEI